MTTAIASKIKQAEWREQETRAAYRIPAPLTFCMSAIIASRYSRRRLRAVMEDVSQIGGICMVKDLSAHTSRSRTARHNFSLNFEADEVR
jgi:hypothetical protein